MTVAELIERLKGLPQDSLVIMSSDDEGNSYREARGADGVFWSREEGGMVWDEEQEATDDGYNAAKAVVLY